ncbi:MAG: hypothetical protein QW775_06845 [Ignisphaera sp.]|uniref:Uncharacterized protein n=1 Tax=Ignisphaera aggregans TaxID=334771 RepID=A0A7C4JL60_9CREN
MKKGIWVADFCPSCMKKVITSTILEEFRKELLEEGLEKALKLVYKIPDIAKFDILITKDRDSPEPWDAPIVYPLCRNCSRFARTDRFKEKIANNLKQNKHKLQFIEGFDFKEWVSKSREGRCIF